MVPIHDSDIAAERWAQAEWQHYEFWEKLEVKQRRRRNLLIAATAVVFLLLSSVPVFVNHWPKWMALEATRELAQQINAVKRLAGTEHQAFRLSFPDEHRLNYVITESADCSVPEGQGKVIQTGSLLGPAEANGYALLSPEDGRGFGIPGLVQSICYDPLKGSDETQTDSSISGFGVLPVKDLAQKRLDRLSILIFKGPSAKVSFAFGGE